MEKVSLPINPVKKQELSIGVKTKIAAWTIVVFGGLGILGVLGWFISLGPWSLSLAIESIIFLIILTSLSIFPGILFFLPGLFLLRRKKWAWKFAIISLPVGMILWLLFILLMLPPAGRPVGLIPFIISSIIIFITFVPLILLLLDRKNFWKIAT